MVARDDYATHTFVMGTDDNANKDVDTGMDRLNELANDDPFSKEAADAATKRMEARETATAVAEPEPPGEPKLIAGDAPGSDKVDWPQGIVRLPIQNWITAEDLGFSERNKLTIVDRAKAGDAKAIKILNTTCQVLLELMKRDKEMRHSVNERNQPLYFDNHGNLTTESGSKTERDMDGRFLRFRPALEERSKHGVKAGREAGSGPGTAWNEPGEWKKRVEENFYELFPKLKYREWKPAFSAGQFGTVPGAVEYAKQKHAEGMDPQTGMERQATLAWLEPFLKNPVSDWDGQI